MDPSMTLGKRLHDVLRWSEKYTKTDMVYLDTGGFWSTFAQIVTAGATLLLAIVVSRWVPKEAYGTYKFILSLVGLLGTFSLNNLSTAVFQSTASGHDGALQQGFKENLRWSFLIFIGSLAMAVYYFALHNNVIAIGILLAGSLSPFLASANLASSFLAGKKDFKRQSLYFGIWGSGIPILSLLITIFFTKDPLWFVIVYSLANMLSSLYFYKKTLDIYRPDAAKKDPGMMRYSKHLSAIGILGGIAGNLDQILLFHYVGAAELAIYNFATAILDQAGGPLKTVGSMLTASYASHTEQNIRRDMWNKVMWLSIFGITVIAIYIPLAPFLYGFLFPGYVSAVPYSQLYAISMLGVIGTPFAAYLTAKKKVKEQYILSITSYVAQILFMLVGVVFWGLLGLVWARVIIRLGGAVGSYSLYAANSKDHNHA